MKTFLALGLAAAGVCPLLAADTNTATSDLKDQKAKVSYSIGLNWGNMLKRSGYDVDVDTVAGAIRDVLAGHDLKLTDQQAREVMMAYQKDMNAKKEAERLKLAEKNRKEGQAFLAENKNKPGVKTHEVALPDGKIAELQYKVITDGTGPSPKSNDVVTVNYRGTLINGKEFDSTAKHGGQPSKLPANRFVRGWTEALQLMKVGSKWNLYIPSTLAYGDSAMGQDIEPGSTLIFEVELVNIETPEPPAQAQPLTSDIIRVPSAEELKAGAKIEVLKPEDVEKAKKAAEKQEKKP